MSLGFRQQMPVDGFIADFACPAVKLVVKIDGSQHGEARAAHDARRTARLEALGWTVLRFWNDDVLRDLGGVCRHVATVAAELRRADEKSDDPND